MENLHIETTQNVTIEHNFASIGERILAQLIDFFFILVYLGLIFFILSSISFGGGSIMWLFLLPVFFYSLLCELIFNGQTFGKMILKIKVSKLDGSETSFLSYFLRWIFKPVDVWLLLGSIGIITIVVSKHAQRFGDMAAGTSLIRLNAKANLHDTIFVELPSNYQLNFQEVGLLTEKDINTIHAVIKFCKSNKTKHAAEMAEKTKLALIKKMGIQQSGIYPLNFLHIILHDYNFLHRV